MGADFEAKLSLDIRLLGPIRITLSGNPVYFSSRKGQWLLALLTMRQGYEVQRDWLAGTLWPDNEATQALFNLRQCLSHLRKALGTQAHRLQSPTSRTLLLDLSNAFTDVAAFDAGIADGSMAGLEQAVDLYRGALLEGYAEDWMLPDRRAREESFLQALERLGVHALQNRAPSLAIGHFRRFLTIDPYRESVYSLLMQALADLGDYAAVTQTYRALRLLLRDELQTIPSTETQALFERLRLQARAAEANDAQKQFNSRAPLPASPVNADILASHPPNNIPRQFTRFLGRVRERNEIQQRLVNTGLVTLHGPGGIGKTRLAIQTATDLIEAYPGGVWFVELAALSDPTLLAQTVASTLGVQREAHCPLLQSLIGALQPKDLMLILDNCEHLLAACADLAAALLRACPRLSLLATSRQPLHIAGEVLYHVPPLSLPVLAKRPITTLQRLRESEAAGLFEERARQVQPAFALTEQNALAVSHICHRLDGIPLALELAAARTSILTTEQIDRRLDDRFRLLTGGKRDIIPRHQTLRNLIDWSYDLLSAAECVLFQRLAVFAGSWSLEAAETVCSDDQTAMPDSRHPVSLESWEIVDILNDLVDKSLVLYESTANGEGRFRLLDSMREYAHFKLMDSGEKERVQERHRDFYLVLMETAKAYLQGPEQIAWLDRLERERDNLRAALNYCQETPGQAEIGLRIGAAMQPLWWMRGPLEEARTHYARLLAHPEAQCPTLARANALHGAGGVASLQGDHPLARMLWEESLALRRKLGDIKGSAHTLSSLGMVAKDMGDYTASRALYIECLQIYEGLEDPRGRAYALGGLGLLACNEGDLNSARTLYSEALTIHRETGNLRGIAVCLGDLGAIVRDQGDTILARSLLEESLALQQELGNRTGVAILLFYLGQAATDQGDYPAAHAVFEECLIIQQELGNHADIASTLESIAILLAREEKHEASARLWGAAEALRDSNGFPLPPNYRGAEETISQSRQALGDERFSHTRASGRKMTLEQAVTLAMNVPDPIST